MSYNLSGCVFIRNTFTGAFCLFESMHQLLPLCDEFIVMDLGSDDGTIEVLKEIENANSKIQVIHYEFPYHDAGVFAELANKLIDVCNYPNVLYFQADEIWHENLIEMTKNKLNSHKGMISFWRYQLKYNFQEIKWYPHPVHRIGHKDSINFTFVNDGMNTKNVFDTDIVSNYGLGHFTQWGDKYKYNPIALPTNEMILDVSLTGGFIDSIPDRRRMHLPFWNEGDVMPADEGGLSVDTWYEQQKWNSEWDLHNTKFNIPEIMKYHLGRRKYKLRPQLLEALKVL